MSGPSRPSTKGYAPVPLEERIDDGVDSPRNDAEEAEDDDAAYTTTAPLLSNRSRGNEPLPCGHTPRWYQKLGSWRRRNNDSWEPPNKRRNWRRIVFFSFIGTMIAAVVGLSISTGVLAGQVQHCRSSSGRNRYYYNYRSTRVPMNQGLQSANNRLNFVALYPPLDTAPSSACQAAWNTLRYVPCHEKIWNRSWDNGKHTSLFDPDIGLYASTMCSTTCTDSINRAFQLISSQCTEEDRFDMSDYVGTFSADPGLEEGPLGVITTIAKRMAHTCRQEPQQNYYYYSAPYCAAIMWEDWFIVDGMNAGNLEGLDMFEARTRRSRAEQSQYRGDHMVNDRCDDATNYDYRYTGFRQFGPHPNSTTCDWCTMNWFERKLLSWKKDEVRDPKSGEEVGLPSYLKTIRSMGQRCESDTWGRAWERALRKYKQSGDLSDDWDEDDREEVAKYKQIDAVNEDINMETDGEVEEVYILPYTPGEGDLKN